MAVNLMQGGPHRGLSAEIVMLRCYYLFMACQNICKKGRERGRERRKERAEVGRRGGGRERPSACVQLKRPGPPPSVLGPPWWWWWWWFSCSVVSDSCDPMGCSLSGSSVRGIFQAKEYSSGLPFPSPGPTQESNPGLLLCRQILYRLSYEGSPRSSLAANLILQNPI